MADFAIIHENDVLPVWINLDYVIRIDRGLEPKEPTNVRMTGNKTIQLSRAEGDKLVAQLNQCCRSKSQGKPGSAVAAASPRRRVKPVATAAPALAPLPAARPKRNGSRRGTVPQP